MNMQSMDLYLSVIICTHNPRPEFLRRTLEALQAQTLPREQWEFLLIDNASKEPLASKWDLSWHPQGRHIREDELGLTPARLRGIRESKGQLLIFVDDDNLLEKNYLTTARKVASTYAYLGAWGAGGLNPEFEVQPPEWTREFWGGLALHSFKADQWSNLIETALPCGAGLCVRRQVATRYLEKINHHPLRIQLGRKGTSLASCEDSDLALTSRELGMGHGLFKDLQITHLIPPNRLTESYLLRLAEESTCSKAIHLTLLGAAPVPPIIPPLRKLIGRVRRLLTMPPRKRRFLEARMRGYEKAALALNNRQ